MAYGFGHPLFVLDPAQDNKVVGSVDYKDIGMEDRSTTCDQGPGSR